MPLRIVRLRKAKANRTTNSGTLEISQLQCTDFERGKKQLPHLPSSPRCIFDVWICSTWTCLLKLQRNNKNEKIWVNFVKSEAEMRHRPGSGNTPAQRITSMFGGLKGRVNNVVQRCYGTVCARTGALHCGFILQVASSALWGLGGCTPTQRAKVSGIIKARGFLILCRGKVMECWQTNNTHLIFHHFFYQRQLELTDTLMHNCDSCTESLPASVVCTLWRYSPDERSSCTIEQY